MKISVMVFIGAAVVGCVMGGTFFASRGTTPAPIDAGKTLSRVEDPTPPSSVSRLEDPTPPAPRTVPVDEPKRVPASSAP